MKIYLYLLIAILFYSCNSESDTVNQPPSKVTSIHLDEENVIHWDASADPEDDSVKYFITLEKKLNNDEYDIVVSVNNYNSNFYGTNLYNYCNTNEYRIVIIAIDSFGNQSEPSSLIFRCIKSSPIKNFNYNIDTSNNLNISWTSNASDITGYNVEVRRGDIHYTSDDWGDPYFEYNAIIFDTETNNTNLTISGLAFIEKYAIIIIPISNTDYLRSFNTVNMVPIGSYTGNIHLRDQIQVNMFIDNQLETINGNVILGTSGYFGLLSSPPAYSITDLSPLQGIKTITGNLVFGENSGEENYGLNFQSIHGFDELETIGNSLIFYNSVSEVIFPSLSSLGEIELIGTVNDPNITSTLKLNQITILNNLILDSPFLEILELNNLETIVNDLIIKNTALSTLNLSDLIQIGNDLTIKNNNDLNSILGFSNILTINGNLEIDNNNLNTLEGFNGITQVHNLKISNNSNLNSINGFENLSTIQNNLEIINNNISSIDSFNNLSQVNNDIIINNNSNLNSISGFSGNFSITGNLEIDNNNLNTLEGFNGLIQVHNLIISNNNNLSSINGFINLSSIQNDFTIQNNGLSSLTNFNNLSQITNNLIINNNANLNNLNGFSGLTQVNNLSITNNTNLNTLNGFNNLNTISDKLTIQYNSQLNNLNNFTALNFLGNGLFISNNTNLTALNLNTFNSNTNNIFEINITNNTNLLNIQGLSNLQNIDKLLFKDNNNLTTFDLSNLITVANYIAIINNDNISTLDFLTNLTLIDCGSEYSFNGHNGNLILEGNYNLHNLCGLIDFFTNTGLCSNEYYIGQNAFNPTHQDIINGNCSN